MKSGNRRKGYAVHICGIPEGPYRYGGFFFEIHPYCGPSELLPNGDPVNRAPSRKFLEVWGVFDKLRQAEKDLYAVRSMISSREQRRQLERDNLKYPVALALLPLSEWQHLSSANGQIEVWRSREYLVQVFAEKNGIIRLTICRTAHNGVDWEQDIPWEDLQRLKRECGRGELDAVEVFPADRDIVNVANLRHLWILPQPLPFAWRRNNAPHP